MRKYETFLLGHHTQKIDETVSPRRQPMSEKDWNEAICWLGLPLFAVGIIAFAVPFYFFWGRNIFQTPQWCNNPWPLPCLLLSIILHEGLHGLAMCVFGKVSWRSVRFGIKRWPYLFAYAACKAPMTMRMFRQTLALPFLVLGFVPGVLGLMLGNVSLTLWGAINFALGGGDVVVLLLTSHEPADKVIRTM